MRFASMLLLFFTWNLSGLQETQSPPVPDSVPGTPPPPGVPIDDYVIVLFISGLAFGAYKAYQIVKKRQTLSS
ncbi:MAG: hypothetical protein AAGH46_10690 [Bacteroidota bacterium]